MVMLVINLLVLSIVSLASANVEEDQGKHFQHCGCISSCNRVIVLQLRIVLPCYS